MPRNADIKTFALPFINSSQTANAFFVKGERGVMIDCGPKQITPENPLLSGLEKCGEDPGAVNVYFTHGHQDHTGGAAAMLSLGAGLFITEPDSAFLCDHAKAFASEMLPVCRMTDQNDDEIAASKKELIATLSSETKEIKMIAPGDKIDLGGLTLYVTDLSGHTGGSVGYYSEYEGILLAGDSVCGTGPRDGCFPLICSTESYIATMIRLKTADTKRMLLSHDFSAPGLGPAYDFAGKSLEKLISASLEFAERLRDETAKHKEQQDASFTDVCNEIIAAMPESYGYLPVEKQQAPLLTLRTLVFALRDYAGWEI
ncbi:MAG: MBL fold metallo-hydrolase [Oscillospiraceae bacterium]|nr:MBL fold metallo-hydrolase [Oscillospiraceae bacterium]